MRGSTEIEEETKLIENKINEAEEKKDLMGYLGELKMELALARLSESNWDFTHIPTFDDIPKGANENWLNKYN